MEVYGFSVGNAAKFLGVEELRPNFSWKIRSDKTNVKQTSYCLALFLGDQKIWEKSAKTEESVSVAYDGEPLLPRKKYRVELLVEDNYGEKFKKELNFETGKLGEPFSAKFIGYFSEELPVFACTKKVFFRAKVKEARLYATAKGLYEFFIDNQRVGDVYFAPFWMDYTHTLEYQTYDVTSLLVEGQSELKMLIGKGWYAGAMGFAGEKANYGKETAGLAELRVVYEDGSEEIFGTDETWQAESTEITDSEFYYGEKQDFTKEKKVFPVSVYSIGEAELVGQINEPVRVTQELQPNQVIHTPKGEYVLDFGQNLAGFVRLELEENMAQTITVRHAEILDENGNFYTENLRSAISVDTYMVSGKEKILQPHFTSHGFRYIQIIAENPEKIKAVALVLHSDMPIAGKFECSHAKINQLQSNIVWGQRGNFIDVPTDCPQRDERLGWTGDANVFFRTAAFNYNVAAFFRKWLHDLATEQATDGGVPHVVPNIMKTTDGAALWSDCATMIPWNQYLVYGDKTALRAQFSSMKKWVDYVASKCGENGLWQTGFQYGDWLALDSGNAESRTGASDKYFIANVFYFVSTEIVANAAKALNLDEIYSEYSVRKNLILRALRKEYFTSTGRMVSETQTACTLALYFNIAPKKYRNRVLLALKNNLAENKNHMNTGFAGTPFLLHALSENGDHETATKILFNEDYPSWLYAVNMGATTIWERWNGILPDGKPYDPAMNSFNHYAYGSVGDFLYRKVAGLNEGAPGYKKIIVKPHLTHNIESARVEYESVYGKIVCGYECRQGQIRIFAEIPCNTTAEIYLPEKGEKITVGSGQYEYVYPTTTDLTPRRFTMESTFGSLIAFDEAKRILETLAPGVLSGPMIAFANAMTLSELCAYSGADGERLFTAVIAQMNELDRLGKL